MNKESFDFVLCVHEPDGEFQFSFPNLDEVMKFAHICDMFGFKISRFEMYFYNLDELD